MFLKLMMLFCPIRPFCLSWESTLMSDRIAFVSLFLEIFVFLELKKFPNKDFFFGESALSLNSKISFFCGFSNFIGAFPGEIRPSNLPADV